MATSTRLSTTSGRPLARLASCPPPRIIIASRLVGTTSGASDASQRHPGIDAGMLLRWTDCTTTHTFPALVCTITSSMSSPACG
jgi:hypothetical protein